MHVFGIITILEENKAHAVVRVGLEVWRINECCTKNGRNTHVSTSHLELENLLLVVCYLLINCETELKYKLGGCGGKLFQNAHMKAYVVCFAGCSFSIILQIMY